MIGAKRMEHFKKLKMSEIAPLVKSKTYLMYGTHEGRFIEKRARDTFEKLSCEKFLISVEGAKHDISNPEYLKQIQDIIDKL
jgi:hypothetical protein